MYDLDNLRYRLLLDTAGREVTNYLDLQKLVRDLEYLFHSIETKDDEWQNAFMEKWWILEEYNGIFYNGDNASLFAEMLIKINTVRKELVKIIHQQF